MFDFRSCTQKVETESLQPPLHVSLKGGCDNRITFKGITIPGSPQNLSQDSWSTAGSAKALERNGQLISGIEGLVVEKHTKERFGEN